MLNQQPETENLDYLKENDPIGYAVKVAELSQREKQLAQVQAERQRIAQQQEQERQEQLGSVIPMLDKMRAMSLVASSAP